MIKMASNVKVLKPILKIDHGKVQNNYLKLISDTSLKEDQHNDALYEFEPGEQTDSSR